MTVTPEAQTVWLDDPAASIAGRWPERSPHSAYEADVIRQRREEVLRPKAAERQKAGVPSPNLGEGDRRTAKAAALGTG